MAENNETTIVIAYFFLLKHKGRSIKHLNRNERNFWINETYIAFKQSINTPMHSDFKCLGLNAWITQLWSDSFD